MTAHPVIAAPPPTVNVVLPLITQTEGNANESWKARVGRTLKQRAKVRQVLPWHFLAIGWTMTVRRQVARRRTEMGWRKLVIERPVVAAFPGPLTVTLTRIAPGNGLDPHDNLPGSQKHVVDEIAALLGIDDRDERVTWKYAQVRGSKKDLTLKDGYGVRIQIATRIESRMRSA